MNIMNKNIVRSILYFFTLMTALTSCSLKETPIDFFESDTFYKDNNSLVQGVNGCYESLKNELYYSNIFTSAVFASADYGMGTTGKGSIEEFTKAQLFSDHRFIKNIWSTLYEAIGRTNAVIARAGNTSADVNEELRMRVLGEARFLRALHYFNLVRSFGNVPLRKEMILKFTDDQIHIPLSNHKEIYDFIIEDLHYAEKHCWNRTEVRGGFTNDIGRATSLGATILLAKVYLQIASSARVYNTGKTDNGVSGICDSYKMYSDYIQYYDSCANVCERGLLSHDFELENNWEKLWDIDQNKNPKEFVFAMQSASADGFGSRMPSLYLPKNCILGGSIGTTGGIYRMLREFVRTEPFDTTDLRYKKGMLLQVDFRNPVERSYVWEWRDKKNVLVTRYIYKDTLAANGTTIGAKGITGLYVKKWTDRKTGDVNTSRNDFPILRSVDLYIMKAEAVAELNSDPSLGLAILNLERSRVSSKALDINSLNAFTGSTPMEKFRELVLRERLMEFATEGDRWFTLKRMGKLIEKGQKVVDQGNAFKMRKKSDYYWPISQDEVNSNKAINPDATGN